MATDGDVRRLRFGGFELQPGERRLLASGRVLPVGPRAFDLLVALVERAGKLVTKDELLERVWPKLVVEEANLHVQVSALRKIIGATSIATIPGHGYRFALELDSVPAGEAAPPAAPKHNLPEPVTSFVGRAREAAEIATLLGSHRLLTLLGAGGIGKTRLALQVAAGMVGDYADGVWFVELAAVAEDWRVPQAVASVLAVKEEAGRPVIEALVKFVEDRHLLLVLDNCEHLAHACAELARQLLRSAPQVKILATSRDYLHVVGETTYPVPPLGIPNPEAVDIAAVMRSEAVHLFADRAAASQSTFHVSAHNAAAIAGICRRLDGIPLAVELAAARVRALSVGKIAERLSDRFLLLTGGDRAALPRQQTLRACIDWSYELLTERERALLRRLSVFAGGWTLEAAEAVGAGGEVGASDVLDLLTRLIEKSLVALEADGERYQMLETVRQYAQERLGESGEENGGRARHLAFYVAFANESRRALFGSEAGAWMAKLDSERENLLAAYAWCDRAEAGPALGLDLTFALKPYWFRSGLVELGFRLTVEALARPGAEEENLGRCRGLLDAGHLCSFLGRDREALGFLAEGLRIARQIGNQDRAAAAVRLLGIAHFRLRESDAARRYLEEALALARQLGDKFRLSDALDAMAGFHRECGDLDLTEPLLRENLALAQERGDLDSAAMTLCSLAMVAADQGAADRARGILLDAHSIVVRSRSRWAGQLVLAVGAGLAAIFEEWVFGARLYGAAKSQWEQMGVHDDPANDTFMLPRIARMKGALGPAGFAAAEAVGRALPYDDAMCATREWLERAPARKSPPLRAVC